jgi:hypothetical protein
MRIARIFLERIRSIGFIRFIRDKNSSMFAVQYGSDEHKNLVNCGGISGRGSPTFHITMNASEKLNQQLSTNNEII